MDDEKAAQVNIVLYVNDEAFEMKLKNKKTKTLLFFSSFLFRFRLHSKEEKAIITAK